MVDGANAVSSLVIRSPMPWNIVVPPERTTFAYKSLRISTSPQKDMHEHTMNQLIQLLELAFGTSVLLLDLLNLIACPNE